MRKERIIKPMAFLTATAGMAAMMMSCSEGPTNPYDDGEFVRTPLYEISMNENQTRAAETFGKNATAKVYELLEDGNIKDNVCYSPLSMQMALSMFTHNCEESVSKEVSDKYLDFFGVTSLKELEDFNGMLLRELPKVDGRVKFTLANSVWENEGANVLKDASPWLSSYGAEMFKADFNASNTVKRINDWTLKKTNDRISLYNEDANISMYDVLYVNALHFIGKWAVPFEEGKGKMDFTDVDGNVKKVDMLFSSMATGGSKYADEKKSITGELKGRRFARIPFGNGGYNMYAVLPKDGESIADCAKFVTAEGFSLDEKTAMSLGQITLPAFETQLDMDGLQEILGELGFPVNFATDSGRSASMNIRQKTFFKVTKDGAEGAGTTSVAVSLGVPQNVVDVNFNRPFIYYVKEQSSGTVLFIGSVKKF